MRRERSKRGLERGRKVTPDCNGPRICLSVFRQIHIAGKGNKTRIVGIHKSLVKDFKQRVKRPRLLRHDIRPESISRAFKIALRKLKLSESLNLHSLRHSHISYLLEKGIPSKRVKELAGHFSLSVTDRYTHALPKDGSTKASWISDKCSQSVANLCKIV
ncbi:MAG: hypothetical protein EHM36_07845 [Deltaproteobacteria bacterium]|nr:MAG: hypothetical protein EHM36_07845 [Deltaproteobacteria bacterium]